MKCEICGDKEAAIHIKKVLGKKNIEIYMCNECAGENGFTGKEEQPGSTEVKHILSGLLKNKDEKDAQKLDVCPRCGMGFKTIKKTGRFGCCECYDHFSKKYSTFIRRITGDMSHRGKLPGKIENYKTYFMDREQLRSKLENAVAEEDYEKAAYFRDKMIELEAKIGMIDG